MDSGYKLKVENPKKKANFVSLLFFWWMVEVVKKGTKAGLEILDLYKALDADKSKFLGDKLEKNWENEIHKAKEKNAKPSLMRALSKTFLLDYMLWGLMFFLQFGVLRVIQPLILSFLISEFTTAKDEYTEKGMYLYSALLILVATLSVFSMHHTNMGLAVIGMRVRIATSTLLYRKITRLNQKSLGDTAAGQVVNLLSNDVTRFDMVVIVLHSLWVLPFQITIITYLLWQEVQISSLAGIISMAIVSLPLQGYLGKITGHIRQLIAGKTDRRVKLMNEVIAGIQVIKMYAWEKSFEKIIKLARSSEIDDITKASYLRGVYNSCMVFLERFALCLTVICYVLLGNVITADKVFSMAQFFNILQMGMAIQYPLAISMGAETKVSIRRLQSFLLLEEKETSKIEGTEEGEIQITNVSASWTPTSHTLKNITLHIPTGSLCAIVGPVGSGKSSLLQLLLGELPCKSGKLYIGGEISYSSQEPWLFSSTVRSNILFGQTYDRSWYKEVVKVCCLEKDFEQFPDGDKTVVGERGVSLSGGQRARINLARAIYRKANIYIMDDPLSAVDTHVGRHLFDECIYKHLEKKTRILVTHQLQYLKKADLIIVINEGQVEAQGSFEELSNSELDFTKMLVDEEESKNPEDVGRLHRQRSLSIHSTTKSVISEVIDQSQLSINDEDMISDPKATPFKEYMKATQSMCLLVLLIIVLILAQAACAGADYWVAFWTNQEEIRHTSLTNSEPKIMFLTEKSYLEKYFQSHAYTYRANHDKGMTLNDTAGIFDYIEGDGTVHKLLKTNYSMYFYGSLIVLAIILTLFRAILYFKLCMMSSINLHSQMFHALLKAPMRFFDINPSGRILNRFSKDMGAIDETLPRTLLDAVQIVMVMAGILVNIAASNPYMIIAMVLFGVFFIKIREWFILTAKLIKHCESATKSPVFSHVNATLNGISTIRASRVEDIVIREFDDHQDTHTSASYLTIVCSSFFGLWLDIVCVVFTACVVFSFVLIYSVSSVSGSLVGLAISQCLILTGMLQYGMRQTAEVIQHLISIERVLQYTKLDTEGPFETPENSLPPKSWPSDGQVEFKDLSLTYISDDPPVLRSLNFTVLAGEKIGIVGRTGAGKSSLISALFRLAPTEGSILIDGLDTKTIGLIDLRKNISIIPQEPVLFSASLRYNLDPFNEFEDDKLWDALEEVELKDVISSLDFMVTEGGNNFSLGQKQLICLARAILRNNRILVLDEATANVDQRTDSFIQATIRRKFKDCTVLTIAHRLNTIMDSDKVLVMSFGHILEYDHPHELLQIPDGHFYKMLLETGPVITSKLKDIARDAYEKKQSLLKEKVRKNE